MSETVSRLLSGRKRRASNEVDVMSNIPRKTVVQENSRLLQLPDEILVAIVSYLSSEDLLTARSTSTHLNELAQPFVYNEMNITHGKKAIILAKLIGHDPRRAKWLRSVLVSTRHEEDQGLDIFPAQLAQMQNLRHLVLETPDCNARIPTDRVKWINLQDQYEQIFSASSVAVPREQRLLPDLESCTLHFVDKYVSLYPLPLYSSIFLHPTLQSLTLSCTTTNHSHLLFKDHSRYERSTSLARLHLEESDFDPDALAMLLRFPKALQSLVLSEGTRYSDEATDRPVRLHGNLNPGALSQALSSSVAASLSHLSLSLGYRRRHGQSISLPSAHLNLTSLTNLKFLELSMASLGLVLSRPQCDCRLAARLPPSLNHIRVFSIPLLIIRGAPHKPFNSCLFTHKSSHGLPNLTNVTYCYEYQGLHSSPPFGLFQRQAGIGGMVGLATLAGLIDRDMVDSEHGGEDTITRISRACRQRVITANDREYYKYKDAGVRVVVEVEVTPPGYIPPYLHLEEKPVRSVMWDSDVPTYEARVLEDKVRRERREAERSAGRLATDTMEGPSGGSGGVGVGEGGGGNEEEHADELSHMTPAAADLFELIITGILPGNVADL